MKIHAIAIAFAASLAFAFGGAHAGEHHKHGQSGHAKHKQPMKAAAAPERSGPAEAGRNWSAIDTNRDNLISPEEMEAFLQANPGPLKARS